MPFAVRSLPLLIIPTVIYALIALPMGADGVKGVLEAPLFSVRMPSGDAWSPQWGHLLMTVAAILLFFEIVRSSNPVNSSIVENALSFLLFTVQLVFFLLVAGFGTNHFAMIMGMTLMDFMAGAMVMVGAARRDVSYNVAP
ncbi:MAG: hypothetical protein NW200_09130 [Hyphomonadaceae bacterium]|nr:hypothetical protein [Hyphomonadaceae bacterium]